MIAPLLTAISLLFVALALRAGRTRAAGRRLATRRERGELTLGLLIRIRRLLPGLVAVLTRSDSQRLLERAGLSAVLSARDVAAARAVCLLLALLLAPRILAALPPRMLLLALPLYFWAAVQLPLLALRRRGERRGEALRRALPDALDLLRACLAAGLPLRRSLALVSRHCAEPVAGEFGAVAAETELGVSQSAALADLARRNPEPEVRALVVAVDQAERGGSPLATVIAAQAADARLAHNRAIVERGARAGPKIQLIVSALIVPGALFAMAAVVVAAIARGEIKML